MSKTPDYLVKVYGLSFGNDNSYVMNAATVLKEQQYLAWLLHTKLLKVFLKFVFLKYSTEIKPV